MSAKRKSERIKLKDLVKGIKESDASVQKVIRIGFPRYERIHPTDRHVIDVMEWLMNCRTSKLGGWKYTCKCGAEVIMYKGCHNKSCPVCNGYENREWLEFHRERMVDTKYLHIVFVMPEELNSMFLKNKEKMTDLFFKVIQKILNKRYKGRTGGTIITEHTEGSTLTLHPHLHCLVMLGGYDEATGKFVEVGAKNYKVSKLKEEFEEEYKKEYRKIEKELIKNFIDIDIEKVGNFGVWKEKKYRNSAEAVLGYFSKSVRGGPISNDRIVKVTESTVTFAYRNEQTKREWAIMELPIDEFIKRFMLHIPANKQKQVRKTGVYASCKRKVLEKCKEAVEGKKVTLQTKKEKKKAKREMGEKVSVFCPACKAKMTRSEEIPANWKRRDFRKAG